jgi:hypothetical protein
MNPFGWKCKKKKIEGLNPFSVVKWCKRDGAIKYFAIWGIFPTQSIFQKNQSRVLSPSLDNVKFHITPPS